MSEQWKSVSGYGGYYEVSDHGRVRSFPRATTPGGILKPGKSNGYMTVALHTHGKRKTMGVHRLVAIAFIGEPPFDDAQVNHKDGDRSNNHVDNLEWVSIKDNIRHGINILQSINPRRREKLTPDQVRDIRQRRSRGVLLRELAMEYGVSVGCISDVAVGKTYSHVE